MPSRHQQVFIRVDCQRKKNKRRLSTNTRTSRAKGVVFLRLHDADCYFFYRGRNSKLFLGNTRPYCEAI